MIPEKLKVIVHAVNAWLVLAAAVLAIVVSELTPHLGAHPTIEWTVRVAGVLIVAAGVASRILQRSTEVPAQLHGLNPTVDAQTIEWWAWDGGTFRYTPPGGDPGHTPTRRVGRLDPPGTRPNSSAA